jgi:hypothetical protein
MCRNSLVAGNGHESLRSAWSERQILLDFRLPL